MKTLRSLAVLALCVPLAVTPGCKDVFPEPFDFQCPQPVAPGLAIAVGARANSPAPALSPDVRKLIVATMKGCGKVTVVRVDGRPAVAGDDAFSTSAKTQQNFGIDQASFLQGVVKLVESAKAQQPEANVLQALSIASGAAGSGGTVVLLDSGVQTTDPLDFRKNNLPSRRPAAVVDALRRQQLLPDLTNRSVTLAGLGYTAAPQEPLDDRNRGFLVDFWRAVAIAAGAKDPDVIEEPNTAAAATATPTVSVVKFPTQVQPVCDTLSVLPDAGDVGFIPDQAEFRNPAAAGTVLRRFSGFLRDNPTAKVQIEGFVAHYGGAGDLSQRRADRVRQELTAQGLQNSITGEGKGWGPYPNPTAPPDKRYDQLNRRVTIEVNCS